MSKDKSINMATVMGALGKDPEIRSTQSGQKVATFSMATNEGYFDANKNWIDQTEWHRVTAWGKLAEKAEKKFQKGDTVMVIGKLKTDSWDDKNGGKKYSTSIVAEQLKHVDDRGRAALIKQGGGAMPQQHMPTPAGNNGMPYSQEDGLPF